MILVWIGRHTMIDSQRDTSIFEEGHHIVHILKRGAAKGDDAGLARPSNLLEEHPVVGVSAGDLDNRQVEFHTPVD